MTGVGVGLGDGGLAVARGVTVGPSGAEDGEGTAATPTVTDGTGVKVTAGATVGVGATGTGEAARNGRSQPSRETRPIPPYPINRAARILARSTRRLRMALEEPTHARPGDDGASPSADSSRLQERAHGRAGCRPRAMARMHAIVH